MAVRNSLRIDMQWLTDVLKRNRLYKNAELGVQKIVLDLWAAALMCLYKGCTDEKRRDEIGDVCATNSYHQNPLF